MIRSVYKYNRVYLGDIKGVLFDLGGIIVDKYSLGPLHALDKTFQDIGIVLDAELLKKDMGNRKDIHIRKILETKQCKEIWNEVKKRDFNEFDMDDLIQSYKINQNRMVLKYNKPLPHAKNTFDILRMGYKLKIGSTTGYFRETVDIIEKNLIKKENIYFDSTVAGDDVENGYRPRPYMIFKNLEKLNISPIQSILKVDDTTAGIKEGLEAGCWTVGVSKYSSLMNFHDLEDVEVMTDTNLFLREEEVKNKLLESGAHYVVSSLKEIPAVVEDINRRLRDGVIP